MNEKHIYTIIRTGCDADRGYFPNPMAEGSLLSRVKAVTELDRLIAKERESLAPCYDHEERGELWWEMCEFGYAAARYSRIEIVESELNTNEG